MAARFLDMCTLEHIGYQCGRARYKLHDQLRFEWSEEGLLVDVPPGFETDLSSVPRIPFAYMLTGGYGQGAAVVHDWLYETQHSPRSRADAAFYEALLVEGIAPWRARLMWLAVRLVGWLPYQRKAKGPPNA